MTNDGASVPEVMTPFSFLIVGGLYSITALRKTGAEDKMYSKHQELKQASKQAPQPRHESLVATEAVDKFVIVEESACAPRVRVGASVLQVLERVLPALRSLIKPLSSSFSSRPLVLTFCITDSTRA